MRLECIGIGDDLGRSTNLGFGDAAFKAIRPFSSGVRDVRQLPIVLGCLLLLSGCASDGTTFLGGAPHVAQITSDTLEISARMNMFNGPMQLSQLLLRKSAEESRARGFEGFQVVGMVDNSKHSSSQLPGEAMTKVKSDGRVNTTFLPGPVLQDDNVGGVITIKMLHAPFEADSAKGIYNASEVLAYASKKAP